MPPMPQNTRNRNLLIAAFRRGFATPSAPSGFDKDTFSEVSMPSPADIALAALAFRVTARTIRRWLAAGCEIRSAESVAAHLLRQRAPKRAALAAAHSHLTKKP
jgi:hypothetical protein